MKSRNHGALGVLLILSLTLAAGAAPTAFSLEHYRQTGEPVFSLAGTPPRQASETAPAVGAEAKKRPWIAGLEVFSINIGTWLVDRYIINHDYSYISWKTMKSNLRHGFMWDNDLYTESFFGHPYSGSQSYNSARSLGLSVWESIPYAFAGYLMWGYFMENDRPSYNDTILTTLGGLNLGELEYRLSSQVLDDSATGGERVGREILGLILDPIRGLNRIIYGDAFRTSAANNQRREPLHGNITLGTMLVSHTPRLSGLRSSPGLTFDMVYGLDSSGIVTDHPFDLIFLNGEVRHYPTPSRTYLSLGTYGPWYAKAWDGPSGQKYALGIFQHYDFHNNEAVRMGGTSTTLGFVSLIPLGGGTEFKASVQAGGLLLSGFTNPYIHVEQRDYDFGLGVTGKAEAWLSHPKLGTISIHFDHFRSWGFGGSTPTPGDTSDDIMTLFWAQYAFPISRTWGLCLDYGRDYLHQFFEGHPDIIKHTSRVGAGIAWHF